MHESRVAPCRPLSALRLTLFLLVWFEVLYRVARYQPGKGCKDGGEGPLQNCYHGTLLLPRRGG